jgi:hypothetical protein
LISLFSFLKYAKIHIKCFHCSTHKHIYDFVFQKCPLKQTQRFRNKCHETTKHPCRKTLLHATDDVEMEIQLHTFSTSAIEGGEVLSSRPCRFTPKDRTPILIRPGVLNLVLF